MQLKGYHLRPVSPFYETLETAISLNNSCLQSFVSSKNGIIDINNIEIKKTNKLTQAIDLYIHGSFWICPTLNNKKSIETFTNEYNLSLSLGAKLFIIHLGSARKFKDTTKGIENCARFLNNLTKNVLKEDCQLLIENTAHNNYNVGSNLEDFKQLYYLLDQPEKIGFCFDTAHAYAYGYNLADHNNLLINILNKNIYFKIKLIHLNDTKDDFGSYLDKHVMIGNGRIGIQNLINIAKLFHDTPLIIEAPQDEIKNINSLF